MTTSPKSPDDDLRALAEAATPGPWSWRGKSGSLHGPGAPPYTYGATILHPTYEYDSGVDIEVSDDNAAFIAAFHPQTALALLNDRDALRAWAEDEQQKREKAEEQRTELRERLAEAELWESRFEACGDMLTRTELALEQVEAKLAEAERELQNTLGDLDEASRTNFRLEAALASQKARGEVVKGLTASVDLGGGANMSIVDPRSFDDGGVEWHLRYGNLEGVRYTAASLVESYDYLLSHEISTKDAIERLRKLRRARTALAQSERTP